MFLVLLGTGVLLMFHYRPTPEHAYGDVRDLQVVIPYGRLVRSLHWWGAQGLTVLLALHMTRVYLAGAYKPLRQLNWTVGLALLLLAVATHFTGYLLPYDGAGYWAATVAGNLLGASLGLAAAGHHPGYDRQK